MDHSGGDALVPGNEAVDRLTAQASEQVAAVRRAVEQLGELRASAGSADGLVRVEVGAQGRLHRVWLDDGVYERVPPAELAKVIIGLVRNATADAADRTRDIIGPVLPEGLPAGRDWWQWAPG
jgi:DNA-binding protein YbaB